MSLHEVRIGEARASDGTELHYRVYGPPMGDAPVIALCDGIGCDGFVWKYLLPQLSDRFTVVHGHYRGHGRSGKAASMDRYRIEDCVSDLFTTLDAAGAPGAVLFGHSMGVQVSLEAALTRPERILGLALLCGSFGRPLDTFHDHSLLKAFLPAAMRVVNRYAEPVRRLLERVMPTEIGWVVAQMTEVDGRFLRREDFAPYLEHLASMDPDVFLRMLHDASMHTTEGRLGDIDVPALVLGGEKDRFTPYWVSEVMADALPRGELHMIRGGTHTAPLEHSELTGLLVDEFLAKNELDARPRRGSYARSSSS